MKERIVLIGLSAYGLVDYLRMFGDCSNVVP